jgi:hypothetical protein
MSTALLQNPLLIYPSQTYDTLESIRLKSNYFYDGIATLHNGRLSGLLPPVDPTDATSKQYVDTVVGGHPGGPYNSIQFNDNGTFNGTSNLSWSNDNEILTINGSAIINVITSSYIDVTTILGSYLNVTNITGLNVIGTNASFSALNMNTGYIVGVSDITNLDPGHYAANKNYVDSKIGSNPQGPDGALQINGNGIFTGYSNLVWTSSTSVFDINGSLNLSGIFTGTDETDSTSFTNGSLVLAGGLGIGKSVNIKDNCSANEFFSTSDKHMKYDIKELHESIDLIEKIKCYSFKFNGSETESWGLIAQQLEEIGLDSFVHVNSYGLRSINYTQFIALLLNGIKDLNKELLVLREMYNNLVQRSYSPSPNDNSINRKKIIENKEEPRPEESRSEDSVQIDRSEDLVLKRKTLRNNCYKFCFKCNQWIIERDFSYDKTTIDSLRSFCNDCLRRSA